MAEALCDFFAGSESVRKCAISNAAARLLEGDTLHALCKLPMVDLQHNIGKLSSPVLKKHRQRWKTAVAMFLDEISMVAPDQLLQADERLKQAKGEFNVSFGHLVCVFTCDFLQLPPVKKRTLATKMDDAGFVKASKAFRKHRSEDSDEEDDNDDAKKELAFAEVRQGLELWRSFENVISLKTNIRTPGILSRLLTEMREGHISDEMWELYQSRVITVNDARLRQAPFSTKFVRYLVHRHSIRARQSYQNAVDATRAQGKALFILQASDIAHEEDEADFSDGMRRDLLAEANPRETKLLPSFLPLYVGMRLSLYSKDCVRFGLMNGCECILEKIVFSDLEDLPAELVAGDAFQLRYLPVSLILRAVDAPWAMVGQNLPKLPDSMSRHGLFQLRPAQVHLRRKVEKDKFINIKRSQFAVLPSDTKIVYAAQGETYEAMVADMLKPPLMSYDIYWLACYVMLSRAKSLEGFLVLRPALKADLDRKPPQDLVDEIDRLLALEKTCTRKLAKYLKSLHGKVPDAVLALFAPHAEELEEEQVQAARAKAMNGTKHSRVNGTAQPAAQLQETKRRRITGKQKPPPWFLAVGLAFSAVLVSKRRAQASSHPVCRPDKRARLDCAMDDATVAEIPAAPSAAKADSNLPLAPADVEVFCTACDHVCAESTSGCAECCRTCHDDCSSNLCSQNSLLCKTCFENYAVATRIDSPICNLAQQNSHCHACEREGCYRTNVYCAKHLRNDIPMHEARPCGFYNSNSSCYMNAAIQAIFAASPLRLQLRCLWEDLSLELRERLLAPIPDLGVPLEKALAALFWRSYTNIRDTPLFPSRFLAQFHMNRQDDSSQFLMQLFHGGAAQFCPQLNERLGFQINRCKVCSCDHKMSMLPEYKNSLELPLVEAEGQVMLSVQQALNYYMDSLDEVQELKDTCTSCQMERDNFTIVNRVADFPEVLMITLKRWAEAGVAGGILDTVAVDLELLCVKTSYRLQSVVNHLGQTIHHGHYVTIARHPTSHCEWWLYDDGNVSPATMEEVTSCASLPGWGHMHSYVLFYERV